MTFASMGTFCPTPNNEYRMTPVLPPLAPRHPHVHEQHGDQRQDPWFWLRDDSRQDPAVRAYLEAENAYSQAVLAQTAPLQQTLYDEMAGRLQPTELSVPYWLRGFWYRHRFDAGAEHPVYERLPDLAATPEPLLDANERAAGQPFYQLSSLAVSPDNRLLAVSEDLGARRQYRIQVRDLASGDWLTDALENTSGELVWAADSRQLFYVTLDEETLLPCRLWCHTLGEPQAQDRLIYEELDDSFYLSLDLSRSEAYLLICLESTLSTEVWCLPTDAPTGQPDCLLPRQEGHEYYLDHLAGHWLIRSNRDGANFGLYRAAEASPRQWQTLVAPSDAVLLQDFEWFDSAILVEERVAGLTRLRQLDPQGQPVRTLQFADAAYVTWLGFNPCPHSGECRYGYSAMARPAGLYALDLASGAQRLLKQQAVLGEFDPEAYTSQRLLLPARDGAQVPVSLVYRRDLADLRQAPVLIYGYGAYGLSEDPEFDAARLSLLDRGFLYAIAHVRGGEELGRHWYEQGRLACKANSFNDFIDVTEGLLARGLGDPKRVFAMGGSAGGLLVGAVINQRPELYLGAVAAVPFVDVLTSMLDESLPLTTGEYDEWGDPREEEDYWRIKSYSPYDQVRAQAYPHLLVVSGFHDSQVQYWEPAKWVAKLRAHKTDSNWLLLCMDMAVGHGGQSGRYAPLKDLAREYAFMLHLAGIKG